MSTSYYEKKYPKTLEYMRNFEGRKLENISRVHRNKMCDLIRKEDPELLLEAASTAESWFKLGGQAVKHLQPANYLSILNDLMDNNDSAIVHQKLVDYTIKALRHAVDKAVDDLWSDCVGDPEPEESMLNNPAYDAVYVSQQQYALEWKKAA